MTWDEVDAALAYSSPSSLDPVVTLLQDPKQKNFALPQHPSSVQLRFHRLSILDSQLETLAVKGPSASSLRPVPLVPTSTVSSRKPSFPDPTKPIRSNPGGSVSERTATTRRVEEIETPSTNIADLGRPQSTSSVDYLPFSSWVFDPRLFDAAARAIGKVQRRRRRAGDVSPLTSALKTASNSDRLVKIASNVLKKTEPGNAHGRSIAILIRGPFAELVLSLELSIERVRASKKQVSTPPTSLSIHQPSDHISLRNFYSLPERTTTERSSQL